MEFLSDKHKERFKELILKDKTNRSDVERLSLFYIFIILFLGSVSFLRDK